MHSCKHYFFPFAGLDVLVNNAAKYDGVQLGEMPNEMFQEVINLNLTSPFAMTREALPHIRKTKGNIIFISSIGGT